MENPTNMSKKKKKKEELVRRQSARTLKGVRVRRLSPDLVCSWEPLDGASRPRAGEVKSSFSLVSEGRVLNTHWLGGLFPVSSRSALAPPTAKPGSQLTVHFLGGHRARILRDKHGLPQTKDT